MAQIERLARWAVQGDARDRPIAPFAREALNFRHRKVRKLGRANRSLDAGELHRLRIQIKKLQYATEFFGGLWPQPQTLEYLTALRQLQDNLGLIQDAATGTMLLAGIEAQKQSSLARSIGITGKRIERERRRKRLARRWHAFKKAKKFWLAMGNRLDQ